MNYTRVCPVSHAHHLDNCVRRLMHPAKHIVGRFIREGDTVIDIGCGPGYFSIPMARLVGKTGRVIAVDLQEEMLVMLREKAEKEGLSSVIEIRNAEPSTLNFGCREGADFALAFYVMHELPDIPRAFCEVAEALRPGVRMLVAEPSMHVSAGDYQETCRFADEAGFDVVERPRILFSRSVVLEKRV